MKSWQLFCLLVAAFYGNHFFPDRWYAFTSLLGLTVAAMCWSGRGKRFSSLWWVCIFGVCEGMQTFVCQGIASTKLIETPRFQGACDVLLDADWLYTVGLMTAAAIAALLLDRLNRTKNEPHR